MLNRQKLILAVLEMAGRPVSHIELVKWMFLLRQESRLVGDSPFYDFVPYRFGPFSFALYRELAALQRDGYIVDDKQSYLSIAVRCSKHSSDRIAELSRNWVESVREIVSRQRTVDQEEMVRGIYSMYPWFASKSEWDHLKTSQSNVTRRAEIAIYTVGYEGKSVDGFFNGLLEARIESIVDVRANPISRKYGFAKKSMAEISQKLGIVYQHIPELGIASSERAELSDYDSYQRLMDRYESEMLPGRKEEIHTAIQLLRDRPSALLCMEKDVSCCHRGRLAKALAPHFDNQVVHLS